MCMALRNFLDVVFPLSAPAFIFKIIFLKKMALFFIGVTSHPRMGTSLMDAPGFAPMITVISLHTMWASVLRIVDIGYLSIFKCVANINAKRVRQPYRPTGLYANHMGNYSLELVPC